MGFPDVFLDFVAGGFSVGEGVAAVLELDFLGTLGAVLLAECFFQEVNIWILTQIDDGFKILPLLVLAYLPLSLFVLVDNVIDNSLLVLAFHREIE